MSKWVKNGRTLLANPGLLHKYLKYKAPMIIGREAKVAVPFGGQITARTFSEYLSVYGLMPTDAQRNLVDRLDPSPDTLFDIGANVGAWSIMLAKRHPAARVFSFEPSESVYSRLVKNVSLNGLKNIVCEQVAMSDVEGEVEFEEPRNASVFSRIRPRIPDDRCGRFADSTMTPVRQ